MNDQHHRHTCIKFKFAILHLVTFEKKFTKIINSQIKNLTKVSRYTVPPSLHDNWCYVCVSNCVSGTALAICSQSKGETEQLFFLLTVHIEQPTDVRLFVCMLILRVHVIIIFIQSCMQWKLVFAFTELAPLCSQKMNNYYVSMSIDLSQLLLTCPLYHRKSLIVLPSSLLVMTSLSQLLNC